MIMLGSDTPFRHWVVDDFFPPDAVESARVAVPSPDWDGWESRYDNDCESGKRAARAFPAGPVADLLGVLSSARLLGELTRWSGVGGLTADPIRWGAGVHVTDPGGWLNCHVDFALHPSGFERRLSLVLFLNQAWRPEWGGEFLLYDDAARNVVKRVRPAPGRAVLFENGDLSYHGTGRVAPDAPPRLTAAAYYLAPPRPGCVRRRALFVPTRPDHPPPAPAG